jgi:hypothetical protein
MKKTERGFSFSKFIDDYGIECSIQKSSNAEKNAIWLGVDNVKPEKMTPYGWQKFEMPREVMLHSRMHLTQKQVKKLLPILQKFVETGDL